MMAVGRWLRRMHAALPPTTAPIVARPPWAREEGDVTPSRHRVVDRPCPPTYFRLARTGTVHLVRALSDVYIADAVSHVSLTFWCGNLGLLERGTTSTNRPYTGRLCPRCQGVKARLGPQPTRGRAP